MQMIAEPVGCNANRTPRGPGLHLQLGRGSPPPLLGAGLRPHCSARVSDPAETADRRSPIPTLPNTSEVAAPPRRSEFSPSTTRWKRGSTVRRRFLRMKFGSASPAAPNVMPCLTQHFLSLARTMHQQPGPLSCGPAHSAICRRPHFGERVHPSPPTTTLQPPPHNHRPPTTTPQPPHLAIPRLSSSALIARVTAWQRLCHVRVDDVYFW